VIVLDASCVVELLLAGDRAGPVLDRLEEHDRAVHAPALIDVEVLQALRRLAAAGIVDEARGRASVEVLQALDVQRPAVDALLPRMWVLRENLTAYDAAYVALAEALGCPLVTYDDRIASAPGLATEVRRP